MKKLVVALAALSLAPAALAQEARRTVGVGVSIVPLEAGGNAPTVEVYLPLRLAPNVRVEPSLGIRTVDRPSLPGEVDERDVTLGVGVFVLQRAAPTFDVYFGGRLKLNFARVEVFGVGSDSGTDVILAAAVGAEHYLFSRFSLGAEAQLGLYNNSSASTGGESSGLFTTGLAFLRFYL